MRRPAGPRRRPSGLTGIDEVAGAEVVQAIKDAGGDVIFIRRAARYKDRGAAL